MKLFLFFSFSILSATVFANYFFLGRSAGVTDINPTSIPNLVWWNNQAPINLTTDGSGNISQDNDLSGNGYNFTQTGSARPTSTTVSGTPVAHFSSTQTLNGTLGSSNFTAFTMFGQIPSVTSFSNETGIMGATNYAVESTGATYADFNSSGAFGIYTFNSGGQQCVNSTAGTRFIIIYDGSTFTCYTNGSQVSTSSYSGGYFPYRASYGGAIAGFSTGVYTVAHIGLYSRAINSTEITTLDTFLASGRLSWELLPFVDGLASLVGE